MACYLYFTKAKKNCSNVKKEGGGTTGQPSRPQGQWMLDDSDTEETTSRLAHPGGRSPARCTLRKEIQGLHQCPIHLVAPICSTSRLNPTEGPLSARSAPDEKALVTEQLLRHSLSLQAAQAPIRQLEEDSPLITA